MNIMEVEKKVLPEIKTLLKKEPEAISSIEKTKEGWIVQCDVLEKKSVPETFDLLKIFEFKLDNNAKITGYKQLKKIRRGDLG
nr:hypothetical protein [Nanoarchaeum sp.]